MELTESHTLPVPQQRAWEALNDTAILKVCIPGCESIEADGENTYAVALTAAVGPVKARFKGRMQLADIDAPRSYTIQFEGQGGAAGFGKGDARVTLEPAGDDATTLHYTASAQVGGKLAQIGSRLVDGAARKIATEFFKRFGEQLGAGDAAAPPDTSDATDTTESPAAEGSEAADGDEPQKRKRSWTAWISKS
ncbi:MULTISPECIES: CoxG family protein [unclassified Paraburkholderia]|uniref:CoxG family protein n=1 Tax=unclassified Paraburkholderia TaxID=2615204 RepID=UPI00197DC38E|nr:MULTISPECIES: carbon monoxide dehydrogenase subunit G [unclassified Paraburkholderia]MBN3854301.1 carbon monoxide dehydrogenase subunit G [Paraburkholderia sp. Ac-20340]